MTTTNYAVSQNLLKTAIENKIWKVQEVYIDSTSEQDTIFLLFNSDNELLSGKLIEQVQPGNSSFIEVPHDTYLALDAGYPPPSGRTTPYPTITINNGYETMEYDVIHYDIDDLILQKTETLLDSEYFEDGLEREYTVELRFVLVE